MSFPGGLLPSAAGTRPSPAPEVLVTGLRFTIASLGCRTNQEEVDALRSHLLEMGYAEVAFPGPADLVLWSLPHEDDLIQPWGGPMARLVLRAGRPIAGGLTGHA